MAGHERRLAELPQPLSLDQLVPGAGPWEVEIGFGKGRYLLGRALAEPERRFLGIEVAGKYHRILADRAARRGASNLVAVRGEAQALLAAFLPRGFAQAVHVYFPDPWPKSRHHKRRLFDPESVDLVLGLLAPGGELLFATDFLAYGELVAEILAGYPGLRLERFEGGWPEGPRTNYEAKYVEEGRPILRLVATLPAAPDPPALHPAGRFGVLSALGAAGGSAGSPTKTPWV
ncbi:MAG TPA: tRNA (guanosine(46)-N7)-methyltransferase TrmB [Thermoanaerobaculia bacterium]|nr:tRNA (guanosine(46)-N7)-methyltransferase TrmB [Thermoanaerobaculia bacterium]